MKPKIRLRWWQNLHVNCAHVLNWWIACSTPLYLENLLSNNSKISQILEIGPDSKTATQNYLGPQCWFNLQCNVKAAANLLYCSVRGREFELEISARKWLSSSLNHILWLNVYIYYYLGITGQCVNVCKMLQLSYAWYVSGKINRVWSNRGEILVEMFVLPRIVIYSSTIIVYRFICEVVLPILLQKVLMIYWTQIRYVRVPNQTTHQNSPW